MQAANVIRGALITAFVVGSFAYGASLPLLLLVSSLVAVASAVYDPALQGLIPSIVSSPSERHTLNSLLDATKQTARILGPSIVAVGSMVVGIGAFFITSASGFLLSAAGLRLFAHASKGELSGEAAASDRVSLLSGIEAVFSKRRMIYAVVADFLGNIGWSMGVMLGMALLYQTSSQAPLLSYSLMMTAMGIGSLVSNIILTRFYPHSPIVWLITSRFLFGVGVIMLPYSTSGIYVVLVSIMTSFNGPFHRLALLNIIQSEFSGAVIPAVYRFQMIAMSGGLLIGYLASPFMFSTLGVQASVVSSGVLSLGLGCLGAGALVMGKRNRRERSSDSEPG